jgi:type I restriction enzyme, R subunit
LRQGKAGVAYITDSSTSGPGAIIVVDLDSGESWRKLSGHPSTSPDPTFVPVVEGETVAIPETTKPPASYTVASDGIALSADGDWVNDPRNEATISSYKEDLRRFQKLRTAVRKRYQEDIDFKLYEERVRKLLDQYIHASEVITLTAPVNIFDERAFEEAVGEQSTPASKADMIASLTQRTITERIEEDPVYFERISALIQKAIDDHRTQRISQLEFLNIVRDARDQVVRPRHDDVPEYLRENATAVAFYHAIEKQFASANTEGRDVRGDAAEAAEAMLDIIARHRVVNWTQREDIQNEMRNDLDDYLFDIVRDKKGHSLTPDLMDEIIGRVLGIARTRLAD